MNDLIDAILTHDLDRVRNLTQINPELASARSQSDDLPLDIARSSGNSFTHVSLLRLGAPSDRSETPDFAQLLVDYIGQLSDSHACAGWLTDIEFIVYATMVGDKLDGDDPYGFGELDNQSLDDLRFLLDQSGTWPCWIDSDGGVRAIAISQWKPIYHKWQTRNVT